MSFTPLKSTKTHGLDVFYRPDTADESVLDHSFDNDIFFKGMPEYEMEDGHVVIDIGAHIGTFSLLSATINKSGKIFSIEPSADTFHVLETNVKENNLSNVFPFQMALSGKKGEAKLFHDIETGNWGHSLTHAFSEDGEMVKTNTLESFFEEQGIDHCNFIKFNCEGSEFDILLGTSDEVLSKVESMLVLYHMDLTEGHHINDLVKRLEGLGFNTKKTQVIKKGKRGWLSVSKKPLIPEKGGFLKKLFGKA